ncbi:MAG: hypothetical protein GXO10_06995 [Crenarchaeota archaeon]|nr:hypothetical protein [Thermoproteota archaeon]
MSDLGAFVIYFTTVTIGAVIVLIFITYFFMRRHVFAPPAGEIVTAKAVTVLKCPLCDYRLRRSFREGDHVGAVASETCPIHGTNLIVEAVYSETEEKKE